MVAAARGLRGASAGKQYSAIGVVGMRDRRERERDRAARDEENEWRAETERRGEQLREAWRQRHPEEEREKGRPKKDGTP
jgi:hypothetical protein